MKKMSAICALIAIFIYASAQRTEYPYTVNYLSLTIENKSVKMAYMDVAGERANVKNIVLLHGKNFNGYYWKEVIRSLSAQGFRVIAPDQVGFGKSDKPDIHYSFHLLSANTKKLLDTLGVTQATLIAHSMGGMLATRFALMYPETVERLVYENPIGLEDYKTFVPYRSLDSLYRDELKSDRAALKKYQQSYYPEWKADYEQYVSAQFEANQIPDFKTAAWSSALTYDMIYQQPVVYEFAAIKAPTLIIIGQEDKTIVGKKFLSKQVADKHGNYPELGQWLKNQIGGSVLERLPGVGHIPHIQSPQQFLDRLTAFLK